MNITEYIAAYLRQGKTVELPGIGTFATKQVNAHYNSADDTFAPSHEILTFDHYTRGDKGIVRYIAEQECIGESTAERMFRNYMDVLQEKLNKEHCHRFPGIGLLRKEGNNISFEPEAIIPEQGAIPQRPTLTGVKTYNHVAHDPFAQFEQAFQSTQTSQPQVVEETVVVVEEEISIEVSTAEECCENVADELAAAEQALHNLKAQLTQSKETLQEDDSHDEDCVNEDALDNEEEGEEEETGDVEDCKDEVVVDNSAHDALSSLQEMEKLPPAAVSEEANDADNGKKKKHPWRVVIILLLILLLGGAAYYYFMVLKPAGEEGASTTVEQHDEQSADAAEEENAEYTVAESEEIIEVEENGEVVTVIEEEEIAVETTETGETTKSVAAIGMARTNNDFTLSTDNIEYTATDVTRLSNNISDYLASYIRNYAKSQRYSQAAELLQQKVQQYAEVRLSEILSSKPFNVMEFFNFCEDDYMHIYYEKDLKLAHSSRQRIAVQREVMDEALLYKLLQEVLSENNITADAVRPAAPKQETMIVPQAASQSTSKKGFDIIAGFYVNRASADKMANSLKKKGCDAYIINKDGLYYVSMGSAGSQTAAEALYHHIKEWYKGDVAIKKW